MQREAIVRGPAVVTFGGVTYYSKGDISVVIDKQSWDVESSAFGKVGERVSGRFATVSFTPVGKYLVGLHPYAATAFNASIYGLVDRDLVIQPIDTTKQMVTIYNAAITKMPDFNLTSRASIYDEVEFTALGKENTAPGTAASLLLYATNTFADTSFDPADILSAPVSGAWAPLAGIETVAGWKVKFGLKLTDVLSDTFGIVDKLLDEVTISAECEPLSITEAELVTGLGIDQAMGASLNGGVDLVLTGAKTFTVKNAVLKGWKPVFGSKANRIGKLEFVGQRKFTAGAAGALWTVA